MRRGLRDGKRRAYSEECAAFFPYRIRTGRNSMICETAGEKKRNPYTKKKPLQKKKTYKRKETLITADR